MNGIELYFPRELFDCHYAENTQAPLIVSPCAESKVDLIDWALNNQSDLAKAIDELGAIVFSDFNLKKKSFSEAFEAITGLPPQVYKGDTPRPEVKAKIYESTVVKDSSVIPLHQEISGGARKDMPKYIAFFCDTPPAEGTGQTQVGDAKRISQKVRALMPCLWSQLLTKTLTYTATYLPENSWHTRWIRWLNPSHATIKQRFDTENREEVEEKCRREGLTYVWKGKSITVSRKGIPGVIDYKGEILCCNQVYLDKLNPKLCGGWINYILARILLYPTRSSMQFDIKFDDGTPISRQDAGALLTIVQQHREGRNWKKGDLMILNNVTTLHAKTPHAGPRKILVAMSGSAIED